MTKHLVIGCNVIDIIIRYPSVLYKEKRSLLGTRWSDKKAEAEDEDSRGPFCFLYLYESLPSWVIQPGDV